MQVGHVPPEIRVSEKHKGGSLMIFGKFYKLGRGLAPPPPPPRSANPVFRLKKMELVLPLFGQT